MRSLTAERTVTLIQSRQNVDEVASRPANDNQTPNPTDFSVVDLISSSDDEVAAIVRRTENLALAVIIVMAIFLIFAPVVFIAMRYGI
jgi:tRNA A37 threonylcarbamoyladenosine dehydratase